MKQHLLPGLRRALTAVGIAMLAHVALGAEPLLPVEMFFRTPDATAASL
jgi:hypothetical protein